MKFKFEDLFDLYVKCVNEIRNLGIRVSNEYTIYDITEYRKNKENTLGICSCFDKKIYIRTKGLTDEEIIGTMCHEIIHTNEKCHNHGYYFKKFAKIVNEHMNEKYGFKNFHCGYHEKNNENCEYFRNLSNDKKYLIFSKKSKEIVAYSNKQTKIWKIVNDCNKKDIRCKYDIKSGDGYSLVALERFEGNFVYEDRKTKTKKVIKEKDLKKL